ncbi:hypothetical protein V8E53_004204, partial [Lactarius tabidus]
MLHPHHHAHLGPAPGPIPPASTQQPAFQHPPHFGFQPYLYPGVLPVQGIANQYHTGGLDMNIPPYSQQYGAAPQLWGYGQNMAGGLLIPGGFPPAGGFPNHDGFPNPGAPNTNVARLPNPVLQPIVGELDTHGNAQPTVARVAKQIERGAPAAALAKRSYPNKQVREGVFLFDVSVIEANVTTIFVAQTDEDWTNFRDCACARMDTPGDPRIGETEWRKAAELLVKRAEAEQSKAVSMQIKDMQYRPKPNKQGKNAESKRNREDDILPGKVKPELEGQLTALCALQKHLCCAAHTKPGMITYCWVGTRNGVTGGHCEMDHEELTLWAQYINKGLATVHSPPNIKKLDHLPLKKLRGTQAPPEVHIAVNIAPMPGVGGAMSYVVLQTPNTLESASAPGLLHLEEVRSLSAPGKTASVPLPHKVLIRNATHKLALALAKCTETGTLLSTEEVLTLMD